jgi:hypothetical protein
MRESNDLKVYMYISYMYEHIESGYIKICIYVYIHIGMFRTLTYMYI